MKGSNAIWWPLACSQNKGLCPRKQGEKASCCLGPSPPQSHRGRCVTARVRGQGAAAVLASETASSTRLWAGSQMLTISSWDPGQFTSARSVTAWDQLPRGVTQHTWDCTLAVHLGNQAARPGRGIKFMAHLGHCAHQAPSRLSGLDQGRAQTHSPSGSVEHLRTWAA